MEGVSIYKNLCNSFSARVMQAVFILFFPRLVFSQQYSFINYSVEQGLAQSQAHDIAQDSQGFLWVATLGGISRFDGLSFHNYSKKDGLPSLLTFCVYPDNANRDKIWFGTQEGMLLYNGSRMEGYPLPEGLKSKAVSDINKSKDGGLYFRTQGQLFTVPPGKTITPVKQFEGYFTTALGFDKDSNMYAAVYKHGIYRLAGNEWIKLGLLDNGDKEIIVQKFFFDTGNTCWLLTDKGIYSAKNGVLNLVIPQRKIKSTTTCIAEDARGEIWVGTTKGCYIINKQQELTYAGAGAGLTDNAIFKVIKDREGNLWFATDGDGIYKLTNSPLSYLNSSRGLNGNVVMGIAVAAPNKIWLGTSEGGLAKYEDGKFSGYTIPSSKAEAQKTNSLLFDSQKRLWIGTLGGGLWMMKEGSCSEVLTSKGNHFKEVLSIYEDSKQTTWICMSSGVFYYDQGVMHKVEGINQPCFSVFEMSPDKMLIGSSAGLFQLEHKSVISPVVLPGRNIGTVNCFAKWNNFFLLGTEDAGIVFWNPGMGK
jgi:ligand-binding sensor domain-containing protein